MTEKALSEATCLDCGNVLCPDDDVHLGRVERICTACRPEIIENALCHLKEMGSSEYICDEGDFQAQHYATLISLRMLLRETWYLRQRVRELESTVAVSSSQ